MLNLLREKVKAGTGGGKGKRPVSTARAEGWNLNVMVKKRRKKWMPKGDEMRDRPAPRVDNVAQYTILSPRLHKMVIMSYIVRPNIFWA